MVTRSLYLCHQVTALNNGPPFHTANCHDVKSIVSPLGRFKIAAIIMLSFFKMRELSRFITRTEWCLIRCPAHEDFILLAL